MSVLTRSGLGAAIVAAVLVICGWWWHYEELAVGAAVVGALIVTAIWSARRPTSLHVNRRVHTVRVARGDPLRLTYQVRNDGGHRSPPVTMVDEFAGRSFATAIGAIDAHDLVELPVTVATQRRGLFEIGPGEVIRTDPLRLAVGSIALDHSSPVVVHPRVHLLTATTGAMRTTESESATRRATVDPLSGFVSLREYVAGDDPRLIHWPTTARTGNLMVREHVEVRRPEFTVVLDTAALVAGEDDFEEMVDVAASIAVHALRDRLDVVVRTTDRGHPGRAAALSHESHVLDLLTPVVQTAGTDLLSLAALFTGGLDQSTVTLVTGPGGPSSGLGGVRSMTTIRVGAAAQPAPGVTIAVPDAQAFVERWRAWR